MVASEKNFQILLPIILLTFAVIALFSSTSPVYGSSLTGHTIILDPGHGGTDPGTTMCSNYEGPGYYESVINLGVAKKLEDLIGSEAIVLLTREDNDTYLTNADRYDFANEHDGDAIVSIHHNGSTDRNIDGYLSLYGKRNKDLEFAQIMHEAVWPQLRDSVPEDEFGDPLWTFTDYGVRQFASGVLLKSDMPATLQEPVFLSNRHECSWFADDLQELRQHQIAQALYDGLIEWFDTIGGEDPPDDPSDGKKCEQPPCNGK